MQSLHQAAMRVRNEHPVPLGGEVPRLGVDQQRHNRKRSRKVAKVPDYSHSIVPGGLEVTS